LGLESIGFGKAWEQKKIEEYIKKNK